MRRLLAGLILLVVVAFTSANPQTEGLAVSRSSVDRFPSHVITARRLVFSRKLDIMLSDPSMVGNPHILKHLNDLQTYTSTPPDFVSPERQFQTMIGLILELTIMLPRIPSIIESRVTRPPGPTTYFNHDDSCVLIAFTQMLLSLPNVRDLFDSIPSEHASFKKAMISALRKREERVDVSFLDGLRLSIDAYSDLRDTELTWKSIVSRNPALTSSVCYAFAGSPSDRATKLSFENLPRFGDIDHFITAIDGEDCAYVIVYGPPTHEIYDSTFIMRDTLYRLYGTLNGVATNFTLVDHVFAHVKYEGVWFRVNNHNRTSIDRADEFGDNTFAALYAAE
jgi:hypothetical protein